MKKYTYKVIKAFTIVNDTQQEIALAEANEKGSTFEINSEYIDYEFESEGIDVSEVTQRLVDRGFIQLIK